jgi:hypothetical protein
MTFLLILLCLAPLAARAAAVPARPAWLPKVWWAIGMCETRLDWRHNSGTYEGAFGFYKGSWDRFRPPAFPDAAYDATPRQQFIVAKRIWARYGFTGWGCYTNGGYRYWLGLA